MSEVKHTPGPWKAFSHYSGSVSVVDRDGFEHVVANDIAILIDYSEKLGVCHWADSPAASRDLSEEEQSANAHLIAAAPELLEALQSMVREFGYGVFHDTPLVHDEHSAIRSAMDAIAKATGEQS